MRTARHIGIGLALMLLLSLGALAGCTSPKSASTATTPPGALTAKAAYTVALSSLTTRAPDGKLLVCQSADTITATSTPIWEYLIGSPKTNVVWAVLVQNGKAQASEYGSAGLSAAEWAAVPAADAWKIDSTDAHAKALAVYPSGKTSGYFMGFVTYVPKSATSNATKPMTWIVSFDPASKGSAATSTVNVDMATGTAALAK